MSKPLLQEVTAATGLPEPLVMDELTSVIKNRGFSPEDISLEQLRIALADYMREVLLDAQKESQTEGFWIEEEN